jgi:hypothetical protein
MMANYERLTQLLEHMQYGEHVRRVEAELENFAEDPLIVNLLAMAVADRFLSRTAPTMQTIPNSQPQSPSIVPSLSTTTSLKSL